MNRFAMAADRGGGVTPTASSPQGPACCPNCGHSFRDDLIMVDDGLLIDPFRQVVMWQDEKVGLAPTEFAILHLIVKARGEPISIDNLMAKIGSDAFGAAARVHVSRIRRKMPGAPVVTVWGKGFAWRPA